MQLWVSNTALPQGEMDGGLFQDVGYLLPDVYATTFRKLLQGVLIWEWSKKINARDFDVIVNNPAPGSVYVAKYLV